MKRRAIEVAPDGLMAVMAALAVAGLAVAVYLTAIHFADTSVYCLGLSGCDEVNSSPYSEIAGIPIALLGAGMYVLMLASLWMEQTARATPFGSRPLQYGLALAGVLYYAYLTYLELAVLRAVCIWCVASAVITVALLTLSVVRLRRLSVEIGAA